VLWQLQTRAEAFPASYLHASLPHLLLLLLQAEQLLMVMMMPGACGAEEARH
jgi:hypothetical protein